MPVLGGGPVHRVDQYEGPIRVGLLTKDGKWISVHSLDLEYYEIVGIVIMTVHMGLDQQWRYVSIPFDPEETRKGIACDLDNGLMTLQYLCEHPEIRDI